MRERERGVRKRKRKNKRVTEEKEKVRREDWQRTYLKLHPLIIRLLPN